MAQSLQYHHYILTRYNIGLYDGVYPTAGDPDSWMRRRLPLFEQTVKSVEAQTEQNFTWLIIVDPKTPIEHLDPIEELLPNNAEFAFASRLDLGDLSEPVTENPQSYGWKPDIDVLLTSRLDNDDLLHADYVLEVQKVAIKELGAGRVGDFFIDTAGWVNWPDARGQVPPVWDGRPVSMFITFVETSGLNNTVAYRPHSHFGRYHFGLFIAKRLWHIVIHDHNVNNHLNS